MAPDAAAGLVGGRADSVGREGGREGGRERGCVREGENRIVCHLVLLEEKGYNSCRL